jgi:DNA-binding NtrC family response regulator
MPRILIVDDEWTMRVALREMLSDAGYSVAGEAENGQEAIEMAAELRPDLILMDVVMPGDMDGISAGEKIKVDSNIPIVFIFENTTGISAWNPSLLLEPKFPYFCPPGNDPYSKKKTLKWTMAHSAEKERG